MAAVPVTEIAAGLDNGRLSNLRTSPNWGFTKGVWWHAPPENFEILMSGYIISNYPRG